MCWLKLIYVAPPMSALGQERTFLIIGRMSALPPKADIDRARPDVRFVPKADMPTTSTLREPVDCPLDGFRISSRFEPPERQDVS